MANISRAVWTLSLVSLFTDLASEMLYPVMPVYLKSIGFGAFFIGVLEGIAEATAGLSKGYFGQLSDRLQRRVGFVRLGYALSALSKPLLALSSNLYLVLSARTTDRLGKGIRTGARDAILASESTAETKGAIFGFHRSLDTFGAVLGPILALVWLYFFPKNYTGLFVVAFLPGVVAVGLTFLLKENTPEKVVVPKPGFFDFLKYRKSASLSYRRITSVLFLFAMFNSSDLFLLLKIKDSGAADTLVLGAYIFYNAVYAMLAFPLGRLSDRLGQRNMLVFGMLVFSAVYFGFSFADRPMYFAILLVGYGMYAAATDGVSKAIISKTCAEKDTATAIGAFGAIQSIIALLSSMLTGLLWWKFGATCAFGVCGFGSLTAAILMYVLNKKHE